jgi:hypothetical protein
MPAETGGFGAAAPGHRPRRAIFIWGGTFLLKTEAGGGPN